MADIIRCSVPKRRKKYGNMLFCEEKHKIFMLINANKQTKYACFDMNMCYYF